MKPRKITLLSLLTIYLLFGLIIAIDDFHLTAGLREACSQLSESQSTITEINESVPPGVTLPPTPKLPCEDFTAWGMITRVLGEVIFGPIKGLNNMLVGWNARG